jgi:pyruvate dehydrogenase (quinone)
MHATLSGTLATMGSALPYAAAAKFANPARPVIAIVGDGAMQMNGINGLITVAKFWREWKDPRLVVLVFNNRDLNFVTWEQRVMEGEPKFPASQDLIDLPYARYAELLGLSGLRVERDADIAAALDQALAADRPCVLDIVCDPTVPPLPPKLKDEQKHKLAQALDAQDPEAEEVRHTLAEAGVLLEG